MSALDFHLASVADGTVPDGGGQAGEAAALENWGGSGIRPMGP